MRRMILLAAATLAACSGSGGPENAAEPSALVRLATARRRRSGHRCRFTAPPMPALPGRSSCRRRRRRSSRRSTRRWEARSHEARWWRGSRPARPPGSTSSGPRSKRARRSSLMPAPSGCARTGWSAMPRSRAPAPRPDRRRRPAPAWRSARGRWSCVRRRRAMCRRSPPASAAWWRQERRWRRSSARAICARGSASIRRLARRIPAGASIRITPSGRRDRVHRADPVESIRPSIRPTRLASVFVRLPASAGIGAGEAADRRACTDQRRQTRRPSPMRPCSTMAARPMCSSSRAAWRIAATSPPGQSTADRVAILNGLQPGETVVVEGGTALEDGMHVRTPMTRLPAAPTPAPSGSPLSS